jgi:hypothetical protein
VLITIRALSRIFSTREGETRASFLDPATLHKQLDTQLPEGEVRERAIGIAGDLRSLSERYDAAAKEALDAYVAESLDWDSSADELIQRLEPSDQSRARTLQEVVGLRQSLRETLSAEQWEKVFV